MTIWFFIFDYFKKKLITKTFQKMQKTPFLANLGPIFPIAGQNKTFLKILFFPAFLILTIVPSTDKRTNEIPSKTGFRRTH